MIFVTGGAYSGKETCAREILNISDNDWANFCMRGGADVSTRAFQSPYIVDYHYLVRDIINQGRSAEDFTTSLIAHNPKLVVMDEVGCGITPISKREQDFREAMGHCGQLLAEAADEVYYVICGIAIKIK